MIKHYYEEYERVVNILKNMINHEIIIKLRTSTRSDDVSVMLCYERLNKEFLTLDYTRLLIDHVHAPFRKA